METDNESGAYCETWACMLHSPPDSFRDFSENEAYAEESFCSCKYTLRHE